MPAPKKVVVIAGEESGDLHAAAFIRQLKARNPDIKITGIGGKHMAKAGAILISDLAKFGVTGISEVIRHIKVIRKAFNDIKAHLVEHKPDILVLVDYPGFNLRLAKFAKQILGLRVIYYISPQIWAWKANRINTIRKYIDHMAVILPFEKEIYERAKIKVSFVGHPLVERIDDRISIAALRERLNLPQTARIVAMLPGSRTHEIERHMPVLRDSAEKLNTLCQHLHFAIPIAGTINKEHVNAYFTNTKISYTLITSQAVETVAASDCVVVASGTASLECALQNKPMCIIYKASWFTYLAASKLIRVKYLGLCNLLQNEMIAPELLQYDCNTRELTQVMLNLLNNTDIKLRMFQRLQRLKKSLSNQDADCTIVELIETELLN